MKNTILTLVAYCYKQNTMATKDPTMITKHDFSSPLTLSTITIVAVACFLGASRAEADNVYRWLDKDGMAHYSSRPPTKDAKPADLPPLLREGAKLVKEVLLSCDKHGGIKCQAGADKDGSIICYDGFADASARYRFTCNSPKLQISEISELAPDGQFTVTVRNIKSVEAQKPNVVLNLPDGEKVTLDGPTRIEPFGNGDFVYKPSSKTILSAKAKIEQIQVNCFNCD